MDPYQSSPDTEAPELVRQDSLGRGVRLVVYGHLAAIVLLLLFNLGQVRATLALALFFLGALQLIYVLPMLVVCYVKGLRQTAKGVWLLAGVTFLPTGLCFGFLASGGLNL